MCNYRQFSNLANRGRQRTAGGSHQQPLGRQRELQQEFCAGHMTLLWVYYWNVWACSPLQSCWLTPRHRERKRTHFWMTADRQDGGSLEFRRQDATLWGELWETWSCDFFFFSSSWQLTRWERSAAYFISVWCFMPCRLNAICCWSVKTLLTFSGCTCFKPPSTVWHLSFLFFLYYVKFLSKIYFGTLVLKQFLHISIFISLNNWWFI